MEKEALCRWWEKQNTVTKILSYPSSCLVLLATSCWTGIRYDKVSWNWCHKPCTGILVCPVLPRALWANTSSDRLQRCCKASKHFWYLVLSGSAPMNLIACYIQSLHSPCCSQQIPNWVVTVKTIAVKFLSLPNSSTLKECSTWDEKLFCTTIL